MSGEVGRDEALFMSLLLDEDEEDFFSLPVSASPEVDWVRMTWGTKSERGM